MPFLRKRTTLIDRTHAFLTQRIVERPKDDRQIQSGWRFTLTNNKIYVISDKKMPISKDNKLAEIVVVSGVKIKVYYTSIMATKDLNMLLEQIGVFGRNLIITSEPLTKVDPNKLLISTKE